MIETRLMLMLTCIGIQPPEEKYETLFKRLEIPFAPWPGLQLRFHRVSLVEDKGVEKTSKLFPMSLQLEIENEDVTYDVSTNRLIVVCRLYFRDSNQFDMAVEELISDFGFVSH